MNISLKELTNKMGTEYVKKFLLLSMTEKKKELERIEREEYIEEYIGQLKDQLGSKWNYEPSQFISREKDTKSIEEITSLTVLLSKKNASKSQQTIDINSIPNLLFKQLTKEYLITPYTYHLFFIYPEKDFVDEVVTGQYASESTIDISTDELGFIAIQANVESIFINLEEKGVIKTEFKGFENTFGTYLYQEDFSGEYAIVLIFVKGFKTPLEFYLKKID